MAKRGEYPYKCGQCGTPYKHRGQNKYRDFLCKSCATKFMLKGRYLKFRPECFGSLNCGEDYECPLWVHCGKALIEELTLVPLGVFHLAYERQMTEYCKARVKTFGWESRIKREGKRK